MVGQSPFVVAVVVLLAGYGCSSDKPSSEGGRTSKGENGGAVDRPGSGDVATQPAAAPSGRGADSVESMAKVILDTHARGDEAALELLVPADAEIREWVACPGTNPMISSLSELRRGLAADHAEPASARDFKLIAVALREGSEIDQLPKGDSLNEGCTLNVAATKGDYVLTYSREKDGDRAEDAFKLKVWTFGGRSYLFGLHD